MSSRAAVIYEGKVLNVILLPEKKEEYMALEGQQIVVLKKDERCSPGDLVTDDGYVTPERQPEPVNEAKEAALQKLAGLGLTLEDLTALGITV